MLLKQKTVRQTSISPCYLIVSLGAIGRRHLANLRLLRPTARICVLRSQNGPTASGIPFPDVDFMVTTLEDAIALQPEAAIIASPAPWHVSVARKLVAAGVDVLIEKPLSVSLEEALLLADDVRASKAIVMVGYSLRFLRSLQQLREHVMNGRVGHICYMRAEVGQYLPDWRPDQDYRDSVSARKDLGGGVLLELSHELDYVCWLFGMPDRLTARGGRFSSLELDVEDGAELLLEYDSPRRLVSIHLDMFDRSVYRRSRACGELGTLTWDASKNVVSCFDAGIRGWKDLPSEGGVTGNQMYLNELNHFLDCVSSRQDPVCTLDDGINVMRIVEAARRSIAIGTTVDV